MDGDRADTSRSRVDKGTMNWGTSVSAGAPEEGGWLIVWMEIFWLLLLIGALVTLIPIARQVFRRSDDDRRHDDS
ncbi:hypothetical protein ABEU20_004084 [Rhodococcus sp. PAM 2766]|uniref:Uncharacterized protein n=1 Tax=Rhodococcus parequi TaxID=3137122 RepID=A0ABW9FLE4_9NOCA